MSVRLVKPLKLNSAEVKIWFTSDTHLLNYSQ